MNKPASGKQSQLDDEKEHARLGQPGWHERRIRDVSPGGSPIACSARLIVKLLLPDAGLLFCKAKAGGRLVRARLPAKPMNSVFEREPCAGRKRKSGPGPGEVRARLPAGDSSGLYLISTISQKVLHCVRKSLKVCRMKFYLLSSMCHTEENTRRHI